MPFDGNGTYNPPAPQFPAISGQVIYASDFNTIINDIAAALTDCIAKDGQTGVTANIDFGGNRIINLAPGVAGTDAVTKAQAFTNPTFTTTTAEGMVIAGTGFTVTVTNANFTTTALHVALQAEGNDSDLVSSTAFVQRAVATAAASVTAAMTALVEAEEAARIAADNLLAPKLNASMTSPTMSDATLTGIPVAAEPNPSTNTSQVATCYFVKQQAFQTVLPNQAGNQGKVLRTDGTDAEWAAYLEPGDILFSKRVPPQPVFLPCDGLPRLRSSYPALADVLGNIIPSPAYSIGTITGAAATIELSASGNGVYVGMSHASAPLHTTTDLVTWVKRSMTVSSYPVGIAFGSGLFVVSLYGENYRTSPDGITWTARGTELGGELAYGNGVFIAIASPIAVSTDGGLTFGAGGTLPAGFIPAEVFFVNGYFYLQSSDGRLARTVNGTSITMVHSSTYTAESGSISLCGNSKGILLSANRYRILRSTDNGATWTNITGAGTALSPALKKYFVYVNGLFLSVESSAGYCSADGLNFYAGAAWTSGVVRSATSLNNIVIVGQDTGVTKTTTGLTYSSSTQFITPYNHTAFSSIHEVGAYIKTGLEV